MTPERYNELMNPVRDVPLSEDEFILGWHFCNEFDGLLVGPGMHELQACRCLHPDHPVYCTAYPVREYPQMTQNPMWENATHQIHFTAEAAIPPYVPPATHEQFGNIDHQPPFRYHAVRDLAETELQTRVRERARLRAIELERYWQGMSSQSPRKHKSQFHPNPPASLAWSMPENYKLS